MLGLLRSHQEMSRAELARRLGMQRSAIGRIVADLIAQGLVCEGKARTTARGRRPTILHLDSRERCAVAVDVRVTRTFLAVTDLVGRELSEVESFPTDLDPLDFVEHLAHEVRRVLAENAGAGRCEGVGVAVPGMLDRSGDVVVQAPALGWRDVALRARLAASLGLPVVMENAVKAWALAEVWSQRGDPQGGDMVFVNVSDGVGVGLVIGGEVLRGRHNVAGEFGHLPLSGTARGALLTPCSTFPTIPPTWRYVSRRFGPYVINPPARANSPKNVTVGSLCLSARSATILRSAINTGDDNIKTAPTFSRVAAANALAISSRRCVLRISNLTPKTPAASSTAFTCDGPVAGSHKTATLVRFGIASFSTSTHFIRNSWKPKK